MFIGIDPGASGGIVTMSGASIEIVPMPPTEKAIWAFFDRRWHQAVAFIEKVQGYIGIRQPGSAMFKFGESYGGLRMALIAAKIPFYAIPPQEWQKALGINSRGKKETKAQFKKRLKEYAISLYPRHKNKITLATADALLIAHYCKEATQQMKGKGV